MGEIKAPRPVTPLVAILAAHAAHFEIARAPLEALFGPIELSSELFPFDQPISIRDDGPNLKRCFFAFHNFRRSRLPG